MLFLAEISPSTGTFWNYSNPAPGLVAAGLFFLFLICVGTALDVGLVLHWIKRPVRLKKLEEQLAFRALPGRILLIFVGILVAFYLHTAWLYVRLFSSSEVVPQTVIFQAVLFYLPVLAGLALLLRYTAIRHRDLFGIEWKKAPKMFGLSAVLYLAMLPPLWLISALYQLVLKQAGYDFYLQDVAQVLTDPASWPVRTALFFIVIIGAPVFEEIVFRGVLLPFLVRRAGLWPGILLVSLLFGGLHLHLPSFLPLFLLSVVFCLTYARTRSLLVPIGMHMLFNGVTVVLLLLMG